MGGQMGVDDVKIYLLLSTAGMTTNNHQDR